MDTAARMKRVVMIEDKPEEVRGLEERLKAEGATVEIVDDIEKFERAIAREPVDAAFVDWQVQDFAKGPEALEVVRELAPTAARVVLTKHVDRRAEAMHLGADAFVTKGLDPEELARVGIDSVHLGLARQLAASLSGFGCRDVPTFEPTRYPTPAEEADLRTLSARVALERAINGMDYSDLRVILVKRGWRQQFDPVAYARRGWQEKLLELAAYAEISRSDLSVVLGVDLDVVDSLIDQGTVATGTARLLELADCLISVLAFVLELSNYDPGLMVHYWTTRTLDVGVSGKAPWDDLGLREFLVKKGPSGLIESLVWVRSN